MTTRTRAFYTIFIGVFLTSSCASTAAIENPDPLAPAEPGTIDHASLADQNPTAKKNSSNTLASAESLLRLCEILRETDGSEENPSVVAQERDRETRSRKKEAALAERYIALVSPLGFTFRPYDLDARRLVLDPTRALVLGDGGELIPVPQDPFPGFAVGPEFADRLLGQKAAGRLTLRVFFRIAGSQLRKNACAWISGGRFVRMEIDILSTALLAGDGTILARGDTGDYADGSLATTVKQPKVIAQKARSTDGGDLPAGTQESLAKFTDKALPCYETALRSQPALRGTLVLGLRVGGSGQVESPHAEMSSLGNDPLVRCLLGKATQLKLSGVPAGTRISLPLLFSGKDD
jgi:hypothetical protein